MKSNDSWHIETRDGHLLPVLIREGFDPLVGLLEAELDRAPDSSVVIVLDGDGNLSPRPLEITFILKGRDQYNVYFQLALLKRTMRNARALWGAGEFEGLYLPLAGSSLIDETLEGPGIQRLVTYELHPASVEQGALDAGWRYPVLDDVSNSDLVFEVEEGEPDAPIFKVTSGGSYSVPLSFNGLSQGTFAVGSLFQTQQDLELLSIDGMDIRLRYEGGSYVLTGQDQALPVPQAEVGGFGYLNLWVVTLTGQTLRLYSHSPAGFQSHGSLTLPNPLPNVTPTLTYGSGAIDALIMPGAPMFKLPAFSHRVRYAETLRVPLANWYAWLAAIPAFTIKPPDFALELLIDPAEATIVAGQSKKIMATLTLSGGIPSGTQYVIDLDNDEPGIEIVKGPITDVEDEEVIAKRAEITVSVKDNVSEGTHPLTVRARAVDWLDDPEHPFYKVKDEETLTVNASLYGPEIAPGAIMVLPMTAQNEAGINGYTTANFKREHQADLLLEYSATGVWPTSRQDGLRSNGSPGAFIRTTAITGRSLAKGVEIASPIADFASMSDGAVIVALLSTTRKGDYTYVYKTSTGVRVRTSKQNTDTFADGTTVGESGVLTLTDFSQCVFLTTPTQVILWDMATNRPATATSPGWVDSGGVRASWFCLALSDGTISSPTHGIVLAATAHPSELTPIRRDRNIRFVANQYARREAAFARPELPLSTLAYWEMNPGEYLLDRTLWGQTLQKLGTITEDAGGGLSSAGAAGSAIWSGWLTQTWSESFTASFMVKDFTSSINGRQLCITSEDSWNWFVSTQMMTTGQAGQFRLRAQLGFGAVVVDSETFSAQPLALVEFKFLKGQNGADGTLIIFEKYTGTALITLAIPALWTGRLGMAGGAAYRGKNTSNVIVGVAQPGPIKLRGMWVGKGITSSTDDQALLDNLSGAYPYVLPPPAAEGGGIVTPPPEPGSEAIYPRTALYSQLALASVSSPDLASIYPEGDAATWAARFNTAKPNNKYRYPAGTGGNISGHIVPVPRDWNGTRAQMNSQQSKYKDSGNYHMTRLEGALNIPWWHWALRTTQDAEMLTNVANFVAFILDSLDKRGSPKDTRKASEINASLVNYLNIIYGAGNLSGGEIAHEITCGKIVPLEQGILAGHFADGLYTLWQLRASDASYLGLVRQGLAWLKYHVFAQWQQYHTYRNQWFASGSSGPKKHPGFIWRGFTHPDLAEYKALLRIAQIETGMFAAGMTPESVTLKGWDYPVAQAGQPWSQYYGQMTRSDWTGTLTLEPGTSADIATHPYYLDSVDGVARWCQNSVVIVPATKIKDATMRSRYAVGTAHWYQQNLGTTYTLDASTFWQPTDYFPDTFLSLMALWYDGPMGSALGSQGAADTFMKRAAAGMAVGPYRNYASTNTSQRVTYNSIGNIAGELPYNDWPYSTAGQGGGFGVTHQSLRSVHMAMSAFDDSGHLSTVLKTLWNGLSTTQKESFIGAPVAGLVHEKIKRTLAS